MNLDAFKKGLFVYFQNKLLETILGGFREAIDKTMEWWRTDEAGEYFQEQQYRLTEFFEQSGIAQEWQNIIESRASAGADIAEQIYEYARNLRLDGDVIPYTEAERSAMNYLADSQYELIRDVTEEQVKGIREALVQDYAEGRNSAETVILEKLEQVQLQPIHTFSPEARARMIARTKTSRAANVATLQFFKANDILYVKLKCNSDCEICNSHVTDDDGEPIIYHVDEALEEPMYHPNCSCTWMAARNPETGLYQTITEE